MQLTIDQMFFYYADALQSRVDYMLDVRTAVWSSSDELKKHIAGIAEG